MVAAGAGIHRRQQDEPGWVGDRAPRAGNGHHAVLQRLPQRVQDAPGPQRQFIQEQYARLTARKKPFGVGCFPKIYVSFTYPIPLPYGGGNIGVNTPVARVGEAVSSI